MPFQTQLLPSFSARASRSRIVSPVAAPHHDAVVGLEDRERVRLDLGERRVLRQLGGGHGVLLRDPGEGLVAFHLLEPEERVLGRVLGAGERSDGEAGEQQAGGERGACHGEDPMRTGGMNPQSAGVRAVAEPGPGVRETGSGALAIARGGPPAGPARRPSP
jgi:hypothetical protein